MAGHSCNISMDSSLRELRSAHEMVAPARQARCLHAFVAYFVRLTPFFGSSKLTEFSTHEALNNATYADGSKEISFNKVWLQHSGLSSAKHFSPNGLIPPAITGMHNADVIKAWMDNGIKYVVGDNTRPPLFDTVRLVTSLLTGF